MTYISNYAQHRDRRHFRRPSRRIYDFSIETLHQYRHLRQDEAARALGVAPITLKRICQRRQYRWPYRMVKAQARREGRDIEEVASMPSTPQTDPHFFHNGPLFQSDIKLPPLSTQMTSRPYSQQYTRVVQLPPRFPVDSNEAPQTHSQVYPQDQQVASTMTRLLPRPPSS